VLANLSFGTTNGEFYARRSDENPVVYVIRAADFHKLPIAPWQLRERRIWNFAASNVVRLVIVDRGQKRELRRAGTNSWELAAGSQGVFSPTFVEKAVNLFGDEMVATAWAARGAGSLEHYGFPTNQSSLTFELKDGTRHAVAFGGMSPAQYCYAAVTLEGEPWVFELPMALHQYWLFALSFVPPP